MITKICPRSLSLDARGSRPSASASTPTPPQEKQMLSPTTSFCRFSAPAPVPAAKLSAALPCGSYQSYGWLPPACHYCLVVQRRVGLGVGVVRNHTKLILELGAAPTPKADNAHGGCGNGELRALLLPPPNALPPARQRPVMLRTRASHVRPRQSASRTIARNRKEAADESAS